MNLDLCQLPPEILVEILDYLDLTTIHKVVALTCKALLKITRMIPRKELYSLTSDTEKLTKFPVLSKISRLRLDIMRLLELVEVFPKLR